MRNTIILLLMLLFPFGLLAEEAGNDEVQHYISRLDKEIDELKGLISDKSDTLFVLKQEWYSTCVEYLNEGNLQKGELEELISATIPAIDGEELYNELQRAINCLTDGEAYLYKEVAPPIKASSEQKNDGKPKKKEKANKKPSKSKEPKKKEEKQTDNLPVKEEKQTDNPLVKEEKQPVVSDETPEIPVPVKDTTRDERKEEVAPVVEETSPDVPPTNETIVPEKKIPTKNDRGDIDELRSKSPKSKDGK